MNSVGKIYSVPFRKLVRWRFVFNDNRPDKVGMWSAHGNDESTWAWCHNRENLSKAIIETKDFISREIKQVVVCDGWNFVNFQWVGGVSINPMNVKAGNGRSAILGLTLLTRDKKVTVRIDGKISTIDRTDEEKAQNLATFGR